jgi:outer membrane lipoprotein-sorting protein
MRGRTHLIRVARVRFLAPVAAVAAIGLAAWIPTVTASASTPNLPVLSAQQVVAKAVGSHVDAFSGTVRWTTNLGIPDVSSLVAGAAEGSDSFSITSLLSGSHTVKVWVAGSDRQRLDMPGSLSEIDLVHNGSRAWYYDSNTNTVTDIVAGSGVGGTSSSEGQGAATPTVTPNQIAARLLAHLTPTTTVTVASPVYVAGQATYQVALAPARGTRGARASTIRQITIAVDAANGMPLRVEVDAKGQSAPAIEIGFTAVSFAVPSASEFRPLTGSTVQHRVIRGGAPGRPAVGGGRDLALPAIAGVTWGAVATFDHANPFEADGGLYQATTTVTGSFGTAQLLQTTLLNVLILPDGRVVAGFVTPSALEAAAASDSA